MQTYQQFKKNEIDSEKHTWNKREKNRLWSEPKFDLISPTPLSNPILTVMCVGVTNLKQCTVVNAKERNDKVYTPQRLLYTHTLTVYT